MSLKTLAAAPPSGRPRPLLINDDGYSTAVIRQGAPIPWTDTTLAAGHFGRSADCWIPTVTGSTSAG